MQTEIRAFDGITLHVLPYPDHGWLITTLEVALGYGVTSSDIREHKRTHADELREGEHWITVRNPDSNPRAGIPHRFTLWTKRGIARLGMFITSERAVRFREWAEGLIIEAMGDLKPNEFFDGLASGSNPETIFNNLGTAARLVGSIRNPVEKSHYAVALLNLLGLRPYDVNGPEVRGAMDGLVELLLRNAGDAFPDHSRGADTVAVNWAEFVRAAAQIGKSAPPHPPKALHGHPLVVAVNKVLHSPSAGKGMRCLVIRRPETP